METFAARKGIIEIKQSVVSRAQSYSHNNTLDNSTYLDDSIAGDERK